MQEGTSSLRAMGLVAGFAKLKKVSVLSQTPQHVIVVVHLSCL